VLEIAIYFKLSFVLTCDEFSGSQDGQIFWYSPPPKNKYYLNAMMYTAFLKNAAVFIPWLYSATYKLIETDLLKLF
jgi:hypothetical protein